MAKLRCDKHDRRVYIFTKEDEHKAVHRGNGARCTSSTFTIGGQTYTAAAVVEGEGPLRGSARPVSKKAKRRKQKKAQRSNA